MLQSGVHSRWETWRGCSCQRCDNQTSLVPIITDDKNNRWTLRGKSLRGSWKLCLALFLRCVDHFQCGCFSSHKLCAGTQILLRPPLWGRSLSVHKKSLNLSVTGGDATERGSGFPHDRLGLDLWPSWGRWRVTEEVLAGYQEQKPLRSSVIWVSTYSSPIREAGSLPSCPSLLSLIRV